MDNDRFLVTYDKWNDQFILIDLHQSTLIHLDPEEIEDLVEVLRAEYKVVRTA